MHTIAGRDLWVRMQLHIKMRIMTTTTTSLTGSIIPIILVRFGWRMFLTQDLHKQAGQARRSTESSKNVEFFSGSRWYSISPNLCVTNHGIFNAHQLMLGNGTPSLTSSPRESTRIDESSCLWNFIAGPRLYPRLHNSEVSVLTCRRSCQPILLW